MTKYTKHEDNEVLIMGLDDTLRLACCDCGLVHSHAILFKGSYHYKEAKKQNGKDFLKDGEVGISTKSEPRRTAQLRRHGYGYLQHPTKRDKYKLIREEK